MSINRRNNGQKAGLTDNWKVGYTFKKHFVNVFGTFKLTALTKKEQTLFTFYEKHGFKLFLCKMDKSPNITQAGLGWRDSAVHLTTTQAEELAEKGNLIGAWIPKDMVVIDIDRNHVDKLGNPKEDGLTHFKTLCGQFHLGNQSDTTTTVKTGSGGFHLYYRVPEILSQRSLTTSVDTRTHNGYVIAAGSLGYTFKGSTEQIAMLPQQFQEILKSGDSKADKIELKRPLGAKLLQSVLKKVDASRFSSNDEWLEFTMSVIATAGNSDDVIDIITEWSQTDPAYAEDETLRNRIESFSPNGAITAATFLYLLRKEGVTQYYIQQVRKQIGAEYKLKTSQLVAHYDLPISLNVEQFPDRVELAKGFFYLRDQASTTHLIEYLIKDKIIYERGSKDFYYFNGSRWIPYSDILTLIYNILVVVADECYVRFAKDDPDGIELLNECLNSIGPVFWRQQIASALRLSEMIGRQSYPWDNPETAETLTFADGVIDFTDGMIKQRVGLPEEYRRSFIDMQTQDIMDAPDPIAFTNLLANIFPDEDTRHTAVQALSLAVSGTGKFRKFQIWNGAGKNGKSLLMEIMQKVIGDRAITYNTNILLQRKGADDAHQVTPGMAKFQGALFACGSETEESRKISQGVVKNMTGSETMTARALYKDEVSFHTTFQVVLATNYLPAFSAYDEAFIDRLLVIPFHTSFYSSPEQKQEFEARRRKYVLPAENPHKLTSNVLAERAAIIKYFIRTYLDIGGEITPSAECKDLLSVYIEDNNDLGRFLDMYCRFEPEGFAPTKTLVDLFNDENNSRYSTQWMGKRLKQLHPELKAKRSKFDGTVQRGFEGISLLDTDEIEEEF